jgi:hypothetical protein
VNDDDAQKLYSAREVTEHADAVPDLMAALTWARDYLTHPHPDLGRTGAVCPYVRGALDAGTLWFGQVRTEAGSEQAVADGISAFRGPFRELAPYERTAGPQKALVLTFPNLSQEQVGPLLGGVAGRVKLAFVEDGLLPGPAYPGNPTPSAHSTFPSMASPVPLVAIRNLFETDLNFLNRPYDPPEIRARFVASFLHYVGPELSATRRAAAESALESLAR